MSFGRWGMKGLVVVAALALLVALLAACGSDSKDGKTPTSNKTPTSSATPSDGGGDGGGDGDGGVKDLADLASMAAEGMTAKLTYAYTTESNGQTTEVEWTIVQRPPHDSRFEIVDTTGGTESRTIVISTADKSYSCSSIIGSCFDITDETQDQTAAFGDFLGFAQTVSDDISGLGAVDKSEREIAGMHANCFSADAAVLGGASEFCFSDEGLVLYRKYEAAGSSLTWEAKSASTDVSDADFEPPYDIIDIPTG